MIVRRGGALRHSPIGPLYAIHLSPPRSIFINGWRPPRVHVVEANEQLVIDRSIIPSVCYQPNQFGFGLQKRPDFHHAIGHRARFCKTSLVASSRLAASTMAKPAIRRGDYWSPRVWRQCCVVCPDKTERRCLIVPPVFHLSWANAKLH